MRIMCVCIYVYMYIQVLVVSGWFVATALGLIVVYGQFLGACDAAVVCGEWSDAAQVAFRTLERPLFGIAVCWIILACVIGHGGYYWL